MNRSRSVMLFLVGSLCACQGSPIAPTPVTGYRLQVIQIHPSPLGWFSGRMRWSPDGTRLALASRGLYVWDAPLEGAPRKVSEIIPRDFDWTADGRKLIFSASGSGGGELHVVDLVESTVQRVRSEPGYAFLHVFTLQDSIVATLDGWLAVPSMPRFFDASGAERTRKDVIGFDLCWKAEDGIWALPTGRYERAEIPIHERTWGVSSPLHGERIAVSVVRDHAVRYVVFDFAGRTGPATPFGFDPGRWSRSGRYVVGCELSDDGHAFTGGEIAMLDAATGDYVRLTDTPNVIEFGVDWCEATGQLAYTDEPSGDIYIAILEGPGE